MALSTCASSGIPANGWSTFGNVERIRVPLPAARTTVAYVFIANFTYLLNDNNPASQHKKARALGFEPRKWRFQRPLPYRLATPERDRVWIQCLAYHASIVHDRGVFVNFLRVAAGLRTSRPAHAFSSSDCSSLRSSPGFF